MNKPLLYNAGYHRDPTIKALTGGGFIKFINHGSTFFRKQLGGAGGDVPLLVQLPSRRQRTLECIILLSFLFVGGYIGVILG